MENQVYINGHFCDGEDASISAFDRGLLHGDGVFEDIRVYDNKVFRIHEQLRRLAAYAASAHLKPSHGGAELASVIRELLDRNRIGDGGVRVIITRGSGSADVGDESGVAGTADNRGGNGNLNRLYPTTTMILAQSIGEFGSPLPRSGVNATVYEVTTAEVPLPDSPIKWLKQAGRVAAFSDVVNQGFPEALVVDKDGLIIGGLYHVVFVVRLRELLLPISKVANLGDVFRDVIVESAKLEGIRVTTSALSMDDVMHAEECFFSGFVDEIVPLAQINGASIGTTCPGAVTQKLTTRLFELVRDPVNLE